MKAQHPITALSLFLLDGEEVLQPSQLSSGFVALQPPCPVAMCSSAFHNKGGDAISSTLVQTCGLCPTVKEKKKKKIEKIEMLL